MSSDNEEERVIRELEDTQNHGGVVDAKLTTDERVIARVTDGIYRQPGSALRELISNAYDADATRVTIRTDAPRFERIVVDDDGHGMTPRALARMLHHIGGSAKRTKMGSEFGITNPHNSALSPGGRRLIGRIGIGLFSVSQMTQSFQIVTKTQGDDFSTIATVVLKQYSENDEREGEDAYEAGRVKIWREKSAAPDSHGTSITLTGIRPSTRKTLKSADIWNLIDNPDPDEESAGNNRKPPSYYVGRTDQTEMFLKQDGSPSSRLPWERDDNPLEASKKLVDAVWNDIGKNSSNPQLSTVFDYYLRMIWELSLAIPASYVDGSILDEPLDDWASFYRLSNSPRGAAQIIENNPTESLRTILPLFDTEGQNGNFDVVVDGVSLRRPLRFRGLPFTNNIIKKPMVFVGQCQQDFSAIPSEFSGGELEFHAYLFWTPKLAPSEHRGSLIRINGASGTLFDETFMNYQVAEQNRMKQISCEIFVTKGLEAALNIDRESFNTAHPHVVFLTRWLHSALRQLTNVQKSHARRLRTERKDQDRSEIQDHISGIVEDFWEREVPDTGQTPPSVFISGSQTTLKAGDRGDNLYTFSAPTLPSSPVRRQDTETMSRRKAAAVIQLLSAFDLLDSIDSEKQQRLFNAVYNIMSVPNE